VVDALSSGRHVSTFQTLRLSADVQAEIAALDAEELLRRQGSQILSPGSRRRTRDALGLPPTPSGYSPSASPQLNRSSESIKEAPEDPTVSKQTLRKRQQELREQQWATFNKTRPDPVSGVLELTRGLRTNG
jgi:hypothetical protein